jgi:tripartite-type tricarboxylate transporter receptor subunit TctC
VIERKRKQDENEEFVWFYEECDESAAINATLYDTLNFNFIRDITPVVSLIRQPFFMLMNLSLPAKTVPEFIAYAKANPGKVNMAVPGNGTGPHLAGELFKMVAGVDMLNVPYRGAVPALTGLLAGDVQILFGTVPEAAGSIRAGKVRALGVTTKIRLEALPDILVPGYEVSGWNGVGAPKNTPVEIINKLNMEMNAALADREIKARLAMLVVF